MKIIEVDEELYQFIASNTQSIGESASDILRRLLHLSSQNQAVVPATNPVDKLPVEFSSESAMKNEPISESVASAKTEVQALEPVKPKKQSEHVMNKTVEKLQVLLNSEVFQQESKAVVRFLSILTVLYRTNPEGFALATESLQGRTRVYFARDEGTLLMAGNHTKPKQIPETPYWVITNNNSGRKLLMLEGAMTSMHLPEALIEQVRQYFVAN